MKVFFTQGIIVALHNSKDKNQDSVKLFENTINSLKSGVCNEF